MTSHALRYRLENVSGSLDPGPTLRSSAPARSGWGSLALDAAFLGSAFFIPLHPGATTLALLALCLLHRLEPTGGLWRPAWKPPPGPRLDPRPMGGFRHDAVLHLGPQVALLLGSVLHLAGGNGVLPALLVRVAAVYLSFTAILLAVREGTGPPG